MLCNALCSNIVVVKRQQNIKMSFFVGVATRQKITLLEDMFKSVKQDTRVEYL
jgi:hypothetical protein